MAKEQFQETDLDFSPLWLEPTEQGGFMRFVPIVNLVLLIVIAALTFLRD